jgi:hypothetical protein
MQDICHAWVKFEREHGTLEDYDMALKKVLVSTILMSLFGFYTILMSLFGFYTLFVLFNRILSSVIFSLKIALIFSWKNVVKRLSCKLLK